MTSGELREKIDLGRDMWHARRTSVVPIARIAAVLAGAALVVGYLTAGDSGAVTAKPAPAGSFEPAAGGTLRLRDVAIPERLKPERRPPSTQRQSNQPDEQTQQQPAPSQPNGGSGSFDSVG